MSGTVMVAGPDEATLSCTLEDSMKQVTLGKLRTYRRFIQIGRMLNYGRVDFLQDFWPFEIKIDEV